MNNILKHDIAAISWRTAYSASLPDFWCQTETLQQHKETAFTGITPTTNANNNYDK